MLVKGAAIVNMARHSGGLDLHCKYLSVAISTYRIGKVYTRLQKEVQYMPSNNDMICCGYVLIVGCCFFWQFFIFYLPVSTRFTSQALERYRYRYRWLKKCHYFIQENAFENIGCRMAANLSWSQFVKLIRSPLLWLNTDCGYFYCPYEQQLVPRCNKTTISLCLWQ